MADGLKAELIFRNFNRMLEELAAIDPVVEFRDVVNNEGAGVAQGASARTRAATEKSIRKNFDRKKVTTFRGKVYWLDNRYPDELYRDMHNSRIINLGHKFRARGLGKQSWMHLAAKIGKPIRVPAYVAAANFKGQQYPQDVSAIESGSGTAYTLTIYNTSPIAGKPRVGGERVLLAAMQGRARFFEMNMKHRAFRTLESRVKKYPGIFTTAVPPPALVPLVLDVPSGMFGA
jgi:hypothetical protein